MLPGEGECRHGARPTRTRRPCSSSVVPQLGRFVHPVLLGGPASLRVRGGALGIGPGLLVPVRVARRGEADTRTSRGVARSMISIHSDPRRLRSPRDSAGPARCPHFVVGAEREAARSARRSCATRGEAVSPKGNRAPQDLSSATSSSTPPSGEVARDVVLPGDRPVRETLADGQRKRPSSGRPPHPRLPR